MSTTSSPRRRSSRRLRSTTSSGNAAAAARPNEDEEDDPQPEHPDDLSDDNEAAPPPAETYYLDGVAYACYQDMVDAKRRRNQQVLQQSGLLTAVQEVRDATKKKKNTQRGLQPSKRKRAPTPPRRKSSRLRGIQSDGLYVDDERAGRFTVRVSTSSDQGGVVRVGDSRTLQEEEEKPEHYRNRINDGEPVTIRQAVEHTGPKWLEEDSVERAERLVQETLRPLLLSAKTRTKKSSPKSVVTGRTSTTPNKMAPLNSTPAVINQAIQALSADDDECVAKVCPERLYSMVVHPSTDKLVVCAGDKVGHIGIWNVKESNNNNDDGVHLFRPHKGAVSCLEWTSHNALFSASYDGTCRWLDVEAGQFDEIFATYDDGSAHARKLGAGLDTGSHFWTQYGCLDRRTPGEKCLFLATSVGTALHVDLRAKERITWHEELSEKKINTVSLHPNGHSFISSGLDGTVNLWDLRKMEDSRTRNSRTKAPTPVAFYNCGRSVNSAFFSPSGEYVVSTTMAHKLDVFRDFHLSTSAAAASGKKKAPTVRPLHSIRHDNMTGRWLTTFQAVFHPQLDSVFAVGSMRRPRCVEIFDPAGGACRRAVTGDALTAVASRLAFHPRTDRLILVGGNSSGRVTIIR